MTPEQVKKSGGRGFSGLRLYERDSLRGSPARLRAEDPEHERVLRDVPNMENNAHRGKRVKMLRCPNCGALYEEGSLHCPYCRSVDDYQDESEYLEDLDELRDRLGEIPEKTLKEQTKAERRQAVGDIRRVFLRVLRIACIVMLIGFIFVLIDRVLLGNSEENRNNRQREEYLWKQENFPKLDELYEKKDYQGLLEFARGEDSGAIYDWEHYPLIEALRDMDYIDHDIRYIEERMQEKGTDAFTADPDGSAMLLRNQLQLLFFDKREAEEEDKKIVKELSAGYVDDMMTRFALTEQELETLEKMAEKQKGYLYISDCKKFLENR